MNLNQANIYSTDSIVNYSFPDCRKNHLSQRAETKNDPLGFKKTYIDGSEMVVGMIRFQNYDFVYFYKTRSEKDMNKHHYADAEVKAAHMLAFASDFMYHMFSTLEMPYQKAMILLHHMNDFLVHQRKED